MLDQAELEAAHCWESDDRVPRKPAVTEFRRRARLHHARWREAHGHPIGSQPIEPKGKPSRPMGSRLPLDYARDTGANFVTAAAFEAAKARVATTEPHQSFDHQRLWADLLWSPTLAFNLFGDLAADLRLADRAVHTWWRDMPGTVSDVRFAHSPGRFDPEFLNSLRAFDTAFVADHSIVAVATRYHEYMKPEIPKPRNLKRYLEVARRSGVFKRGATAKVEGRSDLAVMWLEHLLLLSMLQHPSRAWTWGRYVVVYPAGNTDVSDGCARYRELLADDATFGSTTIEELLEANVLPKRTIAALRERYLPTEVPTG